MAYISISLGLINLFPIPLLDGGHLMFYGFEKILGKPLSQKTQEGFFRIGMFLLLSLMFFATMNDLRDFEKALTEYRIVLTRYTGSKEEALAQFMIGYIYANVLKDFVSARKEYQVFLDNFPKHELYPSVKFEIDYLGKDINEIPALKHITS